MSSGHDDEQVEQLKMQLAAAIGAVSDAYRHNARMVRVLTVLGQPSTPEQLVEQTLIVLSQVFSADVVGMGRALGDRLMVTSCCGVPEGDPVFQTGWPLTGGAAEALRRDAAVSRSGAELTGADIPERLADLDLCSGVWVPVSSGPDAGEEQLLFLFRRTGESFPATEIQVLSSVAARLRLAVAERERSVAVERLAQSGHRLSRYLELPALIAEAARLLPRLINADAVQIVTIDDDRAEPRVADAVDGLASWPARPAELPGWFDAVRGEPYRGRAPFDPGRALLCVPVLRDGGPVALLYAFREARRPFLSDAAETAAIFANYFGAAMSNALLYRALRSSEESLRLITDSISDLIAVADPTGRLVYASPSHHRELAHRPDDLLGGDIAELVHPADRDRLRLALADAARSPKVEYRMRTGHGKWVWVESALRPAPSDDSTVVLSSRVIDGRKQLEDELRRRATHDPLTGLANRALVSQRLDEGLAEPDGHPVGLLFCDLDKFKEVNDRLGHDAGDDLLLQVADRLRGCLRPDDLLARFGGDEFVVVLERVRDLRDVKDVGRRIVRALEEPVLLGGERVEISVSVGGVLGVPGRATPSSMLRDADAAMYAAKNAGPGLVEVFDEAASHRSLDRLELRSELVRALDRDQFAVHYQPIFDLATGRILGFEALLRWHHPVRGMVPPDAFIPLAEETGAIASIGSWVLAQSCRQLAAWHRLPGWDRLGISVNLSATQLRQPELASQTLAVIKHAGVQPTDVWLEITEHSSIRTDVTEFATTLRAAGVHFSLDDFGISYSNLSHLKRLPVQALKIDRSFVAGLTEKDADRGIVRAILAIADSLGLQVVAEGIETPEQRELLLSLGCQQGQGYLLSRPVPPEVATEMLREARPLPRLVRQAS
ncbi:PAS domain S-box-containing protein/diguanylate cyclase (GGDEF) domain-containing protein [Micromonospora pattaloongensis]|uniref:PAS domain S-box-containing protein/diguanylate cyclase (GGDEF) domain-containing protein n=1 Tax=Micromonospora pattaloongensis TaxID=405436 RepID=A0A1H3SKC5_9ACTN|nr:EAL domain-containing protein [Micromonospora pattaloongensis]SDZ38187.1 PAS domain S-box-containing protein/diguanylate cyclase (GGDEF) domain-containing protein [Micromonospora pattaloongensis]